MERVHDTEEENRIPVVVAGGIYEAKDAVPYFAMVPVQQLSEAMRAESCAWYRALTAQEEVPLPAKADE